MPLHFSIRVPLAGALLLASLSGCSSPEKIRLHLFNPFTAEGIAAEAAGHSPYYHGDANAFDLSLMTPEGSCGWHVIELDTRPGAFRFYGSDWNGPQWGEAGLGSEANFNVDGLFSASNDVYAAPNVMTGITDFTTSLPFECEGQATASIVNPFSSGSLPVSAQKAHVDTLYQVWLSNFYEEKGDQARIVFDEPSETVSEGIGYGMLIFVYADDPSAQSRFDKLLAYRDAFLSDSGLMHWRIDGFSSVAQTGGATDADLDIATALILAHRKWGNEQYLEKARTLIAALRTTAFEPSGNLKSGDLWQDGESLNPSYFSFVAFQLFAEVDAEGAAFWEQAISHHYTLIADGANPSTGLIANWTDANGAPQAPPATTPYAGPENFGFDAIRVPWRAAWASLWYGGNANHAPAAGIASKICAFAATTSGGDANQLNAEYSLSGSPLGADAGAGAIGAYATSCMVAPGQETFLENAYSVMRTKTASYDVTYYQTSLQLLEAMLLTGQMKPL